MAGLACMWNLKQPHAKQQPRLGLINRWRIWNAIRPVLDNYFILHRRYDAQYGLREELPACFRANDETDKSCAVEKVIGLTTAYFLPNDSTGRVFIVQAVNGKPEYNLKLQFKIDSDDDNSDFEEYSDREN